MKFDLERFLKTIGFDFKNPRQPEIAPFVPHHPVANEYQICPDLKYHLFGADSEKDIPQTCPFCGAPYTGPVQSNCLCCGSQRKAFLVETISPNPSPADSLIPTVLTPESLTNSVTIGAKSVRAWIQAKSVEVGESCHITLVDAEHLRTDHSVTIQTAIAREDAHVRRGFHTDTMITQSLNTYDEFQAQTLVARTATVFSGSYIENLFLLPESSLTLASQSTIANLYIGPRCKEIYLSSDTRIENVYNVGPGGEISSGANSQVLRESQITQASYTSIVLNTIRLATQARTSVSAPGM
jgi:hypothetical protein